ncbi:MULTISPECIES: SDR family oxidoreductase [unclassified Shinella]|uniref:SDR family oxidoreductase n=1 Tax=unclassified Shinella TaxID=2643062 RepID=UPI00234E5CE8|nr:MULTISPECIES: SDR family oxidoreductase [unclassified Shinella]MCO5153895.1 SDR family oxidoreductase [Shinella sp.]MDC7262882.1 SDR family oxidoreductase [Shinella sp. HY16]MDC7269777.1 SDR family oxidoreductase [Shinella sp. YZ44]
MTILERFSQQGRVALVTGGGRGLGFEIARALAEAGAHVIVTGRTAATLDAAVERITAAGGSATADAFDIADRAAQRATLAGIEESHGRLDVLVNNVGARDRRPLAEMDDAAIDELIRTDLSAAASLSRDAAALMKRNGHGRLIAITSIGGHVAMPNDGIYPAAKHGLTGLMRSMAVEYAPHGITSNAIAPGWFATETNAALAADEGLMPFVRQRIPAQRWARADEIAGAALFLASDAASFVNGHVLVVDGGMTVRM